jgi:hypothetical protein
VHFQIFLPDCNLQDIEDDARRRGVLDLLGGHDAIPCVGPGQSDGLLLAWLKPGDRHHYDPSQQLWLPSIVRSEGGKPLYYAGSWNSSPPQENELRRRYTQEGKRVQLGFEKWLLPTPDTVDSRAVYADDGSMRWEPLRQFSWMCDEAKTLREKYVEEGGLRMFVYNTDPSSQIDWLVKLLRVNYRIVPEIAAHMELWTRKQHLLDVFLDTLGMARVKDSDNA